MTLYKALRTNGHALVAKSFAWPLPTLNEDGTWTPGEWTPPIDDLSECNSGYHLCRLSQLPRFIGPMICEAEIHPDAQVLEGEYSLVVSSARLTRILRWDTRRMQMWALQCAEHVQHLDTSGRAAELNRETRARLEGLGT